MQYRAPGGIGEIKCSMWLKRCNEDLFIDSLNILGSIIQGHI